MLNTFILAQNSKTISPPLVTTREYGRWFEETFGKDVANTELYLRSKNKDGDVVMESHPGTRIGAFFDKADLYDPELQCWFIRSDSYAMIKLKHYKLAEPRDAVPMKQGNIDCRMLRAYTVKQIEYYLKSVLDRNFQIAPYVTPGKKVSLAEADLDKLIKPEIKLKRNKLF